MPAGFFPKSKLLAKKAPTSLVPKCGACGLYQTCNSPKMDPTGKGRRKILIIADAPSEEEDKKGILFADKAGQYAESILKKVGIDMRKDCILTNALICHPSNNVLLTSDQIDHCRPNLLRTIERHSPEIIIPMGGSAVQSILPLVYKEDDIGGIMRWSGFAIPSQKLNAWICPTFNPISVVRANEERNPNPVPAKLFYLHLKAASKLEGRPWDPVPNYASQVERIVNPTDAAVAIIDLIRSGDPLAFDYECTCLKPEYDGAAIVSCSVSNGERTIAYPWLGKAIEATELMVRSPNPKIASNLKYEERWTRKFLKRRVRNWAWDTMNSAHALDNRPNTTSIKFQAFIHLGTEAYDEHIKPFLRARNGQRLNRILQEIDLDQLLLYNGLDSLLEWHVAMAQTRIAKMEYVWKRT
jgi:uracil-DNA glycosylase family 4